MKKLISIIITAILVLTGHGADLKTQTSPSNLETAINHSHIYEAPASELATVMLDDTVTSSKPMLTVETVEESATVVADDILEIESEGTEVDSAETVAAEKEPITKVPEISEPEEETELITPESVAPVVSEPTYTVEPSEGIKYATDSVNVRTQPDANSDRLGHLSKNDAVTVTGIADNGWYRVEFKGSEGYVNGKYLGDTKVEEPEAKPAESVVTPTETAMNTSVAKLPEPEVVEEEVIAEPFTSNIIFADGKVADDVLYAMQAVYDDLPSVVRKNFEADGWQIVVTDKVAEYWVETSGTAAPNLIAGFATTKTKTIYVENSIKETSKIRHEMGHYVDYRVWINSGYTDRRSKSDEFAKIWSQEVSAFTAAFKPWPDNVASAVEYFAEAFYAYTLNAKLLKETCPNTYAFIKECVNA